MEEKINIVEILKDKPRGIKLYSMIHGKCSFEAVTDEIFKINFCTSKFGLTQSGECTLIKFGNMFDGGECIIFPSKEMRDWSKFAWKKGDVLVSNDGGTEVIFDKWYDDTYTNFYSKHYLNSEDENNIKYNEAFLCTTERYSLEDKDTAQTYINTIEKRLGGKLNLDTLEIEKTQPEFKDGDIVYMGNAWNEYIGIIKNRTSGNQIETYAHCHKDSKEEAVLGLWLNKNDSDELRLATNSEKQQLFDALAKKGKAWDAEKKQVVDLKPKWTPKPFDRVITRNAADDVWTANFFSHMDSHGEYVTIACVGGYTYCLPYNEETAKLIGTTNNWEG